MALRLLFGMTRTLAKRIKKRTKGDKEQDKGVGVRALRTRPGLTEK